MIDRGTVAKSPRSNSVLYTDAWNPIKEAFGRTEKAKRLAITQLIFFLIPEAEGVTLQWAE